MGPCAPAAPTHIEVMLPRPAPQPGGSVDASRLDEALKSCSAGSADHVSGRLPVRALASRVSSRKSRRPLQLTGRVPPRLLADSRSARSPVGSARASGRPPRRPRFCRLRPITTLLALPLDGAVGVPHSTYGHGVRPHGLVSADQASRAPAASPKAGRRPSSDVAGKGRGSGLGSNPRA